MSFFAKFLAMFSGKKPAKSVAKPANNQQRPKTKSLLETAATLTNYSDIGVIRRVYTSGKDALYVVPERLSSALIAIDRASSQNVADHGIWILVLDEPNQAFARELAIELRQLFGAIRSKGLTARVYKAASPIMQEVIKAISHADAQTSMTLRSSSLDLFDQWIEVAAAAGTSDVHILSFGNDASVMMRIDGELVPLAIQGFESGIYSRKSVTAAVGAAYNYAHLSGSGGSQYSENAFCDSMLNREIHGKRLLLRYQNNPAPMGSTQFGAKVVVRLLYLDGTEVTSLPKAGYAVSHQKMLREASRSGSGLIIFAGVTGSGKSTSIKLFVEFMPGLSSKAVSTIEDPIEYLIAPGVVHQMQVTRDISDPEITRQRYGQAIKSLLRSDPDAVMVGEVRDELSARAALILAETGHLAMFSLHAHLISNIVGRLTNDEVGLSRDELTAPQILNTLVYQALIPLLCKTCSQDTSTAIASARRLVSDATTEAAKVVQEDELDYLMGTIELLEGKFKIDTARLKWRCAAGCNNCRNSGLKGRTIVAEVWQPDRIWLELTRTRRDYDALNHFRSFSDGDFYSDDMTGKTVFEHSIYKATQGLVDIREARMFESFTGYEMPRKKGVVLDMPVQMSPRLVESAEAAA